MQPLRKILNTTATLVILFPNAPVCTMVILVKGFFFQMRHFRCVEHKLKYNIKYIQYSQTQLHVYRVVSDCIVYILYYITF